MGGNNMKTSIVGKIHKALVNQGWGMNECGEFQEIINSHTAMLDACKTSLALIKDYWISEHGNPQVGEAWGKLEKAIEQAERK